MAMESCTEADLPGDALPVPPRAAKRKRVSVLRGSCIRFEALPPGPGQPLLSACSQLFVETGVGQPTAFAAKCVLAIEEKGVALWRDQNADWGECGSHMRTSQHPSVECIVMRMLLPKP